MDKLPVFAEIVQAFSPCDSPVTAGQGTGKTAWKERKEAF
jgi:hypothetical protein